ncbi:hypothetical protein EZS27_016736 [termite gut metagenome]|uniref:Uncharacterized protein n=1 Tax=termite gut metagenome TaxID=433724 RepID=A0A5J4RM72_9ZZZZ
MKLHIFLLLPQDDDSIIKILEKDNDSFEPLLKEVCDILSNIQNKSDINLYYDSENIKNFLDYTKHCSDEKHLKSKKFQMQTFIGKKSTDIATKPLKDDACIYVLWNYDKLPSVEYNPHETLSEIAEKIFAYPNENYLLLNLSEHIKTCRNVLLICKDAKHISDLPKFVRIPFVTDKEELELWLATNHITKFSLLDRNLFSRTTYIEQGQRVYQEILTNCYWYLDAFHNQNDKDKHYEVFNANGEHIGEANLDGVLDTSKQENGRTIDI